VVQDINHFSSKTKILARTAQNFCNETEEIQTDLFGGFTPASRKEKLKSKRKRPAKEMCAICFISEFNKKYPRVQICVHLAKG